MKGRPSALPYAAPMRFPVPSANWISSAVTAALSLVLLAALGGLTPAYAVAVVIAAVAGMVAGVAATPRKKARLQPRPRREATPIAARPEVVRSITLVSTLQAAVGGGRSVSDLRRVLAGIAADESGQIDHSVTDELVVVFGAPEEAFDAARRMVSNVEALSRRTGRDLRIAIGIHAGLVTPSDIAVITARLRGLTESKRASVIVTDPVAERDAGALEVAFVG